MTATAPKGAGKQRVLPALLLLTVGALIGERLPFTVFRGGGIPLTETFSLKQPSLRALGPPSPLDDESNVVVPKNGTGAEMSLWERVRYLELKLNAYTSFGADPFFGSTVRPDNCKAVSDLSEFGCRKGWEISGYGDDMIAKNCPGLFDHRICLDTLPAPTKQPEASSMPPVPKVVNPPPCLVYDFGIRAQPNFGAVMARTFGCEVHAFDPSPVSTDWWDSKEAGALRNLTNYHFHKYGASGKDGTLRLHSYNWGQVSIVRYPNNIIDCGPDLHKGEDNCKMAAGPAKQDQFNLKVKTLKTIINLLGHEGRRIDILKVDIEGSEYSFLEQMFDSYGGCPDFIDQVTLEWHHMPWDPRYGEGSSPSINTIVTLLHTCGLKMFWQHSPGGWPSTDRSYYRMGMHDIRYNLASFRRET